MPDDQVSGELDLNVRVALCHAYVDALARRSGLDLLHVKGPTVHPALRRRPRSSTDVDVLVRPAHVSALATALVDAGWRLVTGFATGSLFEHAANYWHDDWGYIDVHRRYPGVRVDPGLAFERIWSERSTTEVAHQRVGVPSLVDQALLLCLHAARSERGGNAAEDLRWSWTEATDELRSDVRRRAAELDASIALAGAIGELEQWRGDRDYLLWRFYAEGGSRGDEWRARWRSSRGLRQRARVATMALGVNREYLAMQLGREPTRQELLARWAERYRSAGTEALGRLRGRSR